MQFFQIGDVNSKKAGMGLTDFFSILALAVVFLLFYLLLFFTTGKTQLQISDQSANVADSLSLISLLRTPMMIGNTDANLAELIALSKSDQSIKSKLEVQIKQELDHDFGASKCSILCIENYEIKSSGCTSLQFFACNSNTVTIPTIDGLAIKTALKTDVSYSRQFRLS